MEGILTELSCSKCVSTFAADVTLTVSNEVPPPGVDDASKRHEEVTRAKLNENRFIGLQLGTYRGKAIPSADVGHWMEFPVKLLGPNLRTKKNWSEVAGRATARTRTWTSRSLSLKGWLEEMLVYIASVIASSLTVVPCPDS